jgi:formate dehydrogenase iron-sulfur subunit
MSAPVRTLIDEFIESQRRLDTPVARFAAAHDMGAAPRSQLIPLSAPGPGEHYAFQVDLDSCTGCKACVAGCHSLNGLDHGETWRDVGLALGGSEALPFQQTVTTACHHCEDPACLNGCPVLAYEKDPATGIVVHLDDQCIGCSYCVLKCPYDVPKYNDRLGIVRKCDLCHGRLSAGEAPACVQACPTEAISIIKAPSATASAGDWLPCAPDPAYTRPTTRYVSKKPLPANLRAADADALRPQPAHYALVFLLVFTQIGLGLLIASLGAASTGEWLRIAAAAFFTFGLICSVAHLGQPLRAWRVFLGLRRSWLSREAVVLGAAFPLVALAAAAPWLAFPDRQAPLITGAACAVAALGVFCSAMIYIDTRRLFWRPSQSLGRMAGTVLIAALAPLSALAAAVALAAKLALELSTLRGASSPARLQRGPLRLLVSARLFAAVAAFAALPLLPTPVTAAILVVGELLERTVFFRAVDSPKMPGVPSA